MNVLLRFLLRLPRMARQPAFACIVMVLHPALSGVEPSSLGTRTPLHITETRSLNGLPAFGAARRNRTAHTPARVLNDVPDSRCRIDERTGARPLDTPRIFSGARSTAPPNFIRESASPGSLSRLRPEQETGKEMRLWCGAPELHLHPVAYEPRAGLPAAYL